MRDITTWLYGNVPHGYTVMYLIWPSVTVIIRCQFFCYNLNSADLSCFVLLCSFCIPLFLDIFYHALTASVWLVLFLVFSSDVQYRKVSVSHSFAPLLLVYTYTELIKFQKPECSSYPDKHLDGAEPGRPMFFLNIDV